MKKILIIDDECQFLFSAVLAFRRAGYTPEPAGSAETALDRLEEAQLMGDPYRMVVLDFHMPEMNGLELMTRLKERGIAVPVLLVSGYADADSIAAFTALGCCGFLQKPFNPPDLLGRVEAILQEGR